jgi:BioD-like phosphotransacetylase family protein
MAGLLIVSSRPLSGKTTLAAGLARGLRAQRAEFSLKRLGDDENCAADTAFFSGFRGAQPEGGLEIAEAPAGDIAGTLGAHAGTRAIIIATPADQPSEMAAFVRSAGPVAGIILNRVPVKRLGAIRAAYDAAGVLPLALVPEDRVLAAPTLGQAAEALGAEGEFIQENADRALDRPAIASIAADPGQTYFTRTEAEAVIVRSDKPDLQLAALNAGAGCLIMTGGLPVLSYVLERVEEDEIPLLRTNLDTKQTVAAIEELFGRAPFRGDEKETRAEVLLSEIDLDALLERAAV